MILIMDTEEKLIALVRQYDFLYDTNSRKYSDKTCKYNAWEAISHEMGISARECKMKWTRLRDNFRKAIKSRREQSDSNVKRRPVKFEDELAFVVPYMTVYNTTNSTVTLKIEDDSNSGHNSESENFLMEQKLNIEYVPEFDVLSAPSPKSNANNSSRSLNDTPLNRDVATKQSVDVLVDFLKAKSEEEKDPMDIFFSAMAANVKKLPKKLQLEVRQKVFNAVNDAEMKWLSES